jgi:hypothetical protein
MNDRENCCTPALANNAQMVKHAAIQKVAEVWNCGISSEKISESVRQSKSWFV